MLDIVVSVQGAYNPHRVRIRKLVIIVDKMDIEVDNSISVEEGHEISKTIELKLKQELQNVYDVLIHIEPLGNVEEDEGFGVSRISNQLNKGIF